ncbi:MAG: FHA domain-containing protein [Blastocatellia bacterium]|nr:FHA domain-containing protein [Blastocatellia bacterium]
MADWLKNLLAKALGDTHSTEPLVMAQAIREAVEEKIRTMPRGRRIFPARELLVQFHASHAEARELLRAGLAAPNELQTWLREHLERQQVEGAASLRVRTEVLDGPPPDWAARGFHLVLGGGGTPRAAALEILLGRAAQGRYPLKAKNRIGRTEEILDKHGQLVRRNEIVFLDERDEIARSVSRIHARIEHDAAMGAYVLYDDSSAQGTFLERDGEIVPVAGSRGVALRDGDLILFGKARARFCANRDELPQESPPAA